MTEKISLEAYKKAYKEIVIEEEKSGFRSHLIAYISINIILIAMNFLFSPQKLWFHYVLLGWGISILMHYFFGIVQLEKTLKRREIKTEQRVREI